MESIWKAWGIGNVSGMHSLGDPGVRPCGTTSRRLSLSQISSGRYLHPRFGGDLTIFQGQ